MDAIKASIDTLELKACPKGEAACPIFPEVEALRHEIRTDALTGLYNLRHLRHALDQEMERTRRSSQATSLIMLDVDDFKQINDHYGHIQGDYVLQHLAATLTKSLRKLDVPCRYGGEEFAVILPSTRLPTAVGVAERLRGLIASTPVASGSDQFAISASLGVDSYEPGSQWSIDDFVSRADQHLYRAKADGRNCVRHGALTRDEDNLINEQILADERP